MSYVEMQFHLLLARVGAEQARIISGAYKLDKRRRSQVLNLDGSFVWRDLSDEEKLQDSVARMERHLKFAQECLDAFGMEKSK